MLSCFNLLLLAFLLVVNSKELCRCLPGDSCFPSSATWSQLSNALSIPVMMGDRPIADVCYLHSAHFNMTSCTRLKAVQNDPVFLANVPNAAQSANTEALDVNGTIQDCPFDPAPGASCFQGRVPPYSIHAMSISDIQRIVMFASKHNLHLVVKNTGHDFLGRSFGVGSVELWTHNMKNMAITHQFVPLGAPAGTASQNAVTIGAGIQWHELYDFVDKHNRSVAGGFSSGGTVGAGGGWPLGGGHSVLSPFLGLGVDNLLEISLVLPNSSYVTVNSYRNSELFWALRGGGGFSFGIVTELTYKTHSNVPYTVAFYTATANSSAAYKDLLKVWMTHHNAIADAGWSGVWPFFSGQLSLTFFMQGSSRSDMVTNRTMELFFKSSRESTGVNVSLATTVIYRSFQAYVEDNLNPESPNGVGFNFNSRMSGRTRLALSSWLIPKRLSVSSNADVLSNVFANMTVGFGFLVAGGKVAEVDPDETSITPAWRTALSDINVLPPWDDTVSFRENYQRSFDQIQPLRTLAPIPEGGQYYNEPDTLEENWQQAFWGGHYPRLLDIKRQLDPNDLFIVHKGVNSEGWDDQIICKHVE